MNNEPINTEEEKNTNVAILCGRIISLYDKGQIIITHLKITEEVKGKRMSNFPKVYFFKSDDTGIDKFFVNDEVYITGHVTARKKRKATTGKIYVSQSIVADTIRARKMIHEEALGEDSCYFKEPQQNLIYFEGPILEIKQMERELIRFKMRVCDHGHPQEVQLVTHNRDILMERVGTVIRAYGKTKTWVSDPTEYAPSHKQTQILRFYKKEGES